MDILMGHLQVINIGNVDIRYVGPCISRPSPALIEVPLQKMTMMIRVMMLMTTMIIEMTMVFIMMTMT